MNQVSDQFSIHEEGGKEWVYTPMQLFTVYNVCLYNQRYMLK